MVVKKKVVKRAVKKPAKRIMLKGGGVTAKRLPAKKDKPAKRMFSGNVGVSVKGAKRIAAASKIKELALSKKRAARKRKTR